MKLGMHFWNYTLPGEPQSLPDLLVRTAQAAEAAGCSDFTVMDHYFQMEAQAPATDPMLEGYTTLGFVAGQTERIRLGLLVTGVTYRYPGLLAKIVATLDVLSRGRAILGIGAAWYEREALGLGVPFPSTRERFERLEETLQICLQMWGPDDGPYQGKHYQLAETLCHPAPIQQPHPPIMIGGSGEKRTLSLVAQYADATNLLSWQPDEVAHKLDVLRGHCDDLGRDYDEIEKTIIVGDEPLADPDGFRRNMEAFSELGITKSWISIRGDDPVAFVEQTVSILGDRFERAV